MNNFNKLMYLSILMFITFALLTVNRPAITIFLLGWFCIYFYFYRGRALKIFFAILKLGFAIIFMFIITALFRWGSASEDIIYLVLDRLIGYTIASYNRFALILEGKLSYIKEGIPAIFYIFPIVKIPLTNIVFFDLRELCHISLRAAGYAGLNPSYNLATLFGGIYQVLGYITFLYFFILGFIGNRLYISFKNGTTFGIIFYPLFYAFVALWIVDVNFFLLYFLPFFYIFLFITLTHSIWRVIK